MLRSMYSGISGMKNFQTKLDVIGNNIANVNTFGYKKGRVTFKDTMNQMISGASAAQDNRGGKNAMQIGLGGTLATIDTVDTQSSLQTTGRALDLALNGDGFFLVKQGDAHYYTRAGNFYLDDTGNLVTGDGLKVQAFKVDDNGKPLRDYGDVSVNVNAMLPAVTTNGIKFTENLAANSTDNVPFTQQIQVVDSKGEQHRIDVHFVKTATDSWNVFINKPILKADGTPETPDTVLTFRAADAADNSYKKGDFESATASTIDLSAIDPNLSSVTLDFSKLTQIPGSTTALVNPDGNTQGALESFNIGSGGEINGVFSNGLVKTLGVLAIGKFSNAAGLVRTGSNLFQESINSGTANIGVPGDGRATLASGSLEMSNVDLSEEFAEMIVAQRGFQANTKIITTSDEILQELVNLKR